MAEARACLEIPEKWQRSEKGSGKSRKHELDKEKYPEIWIWVGDLVPFLGTRLAGPWGSLCACRAMARSCLWVRASVNACAQHTETLHNECATNDAPGDWSSLAAVRHDAWDGLPSPVTNGKFTHASNEITAAWKVHCMWVKRLQRWLSVQLQQSRNGETTRTLYLGVSPDTYSIALGSKEPFRALDYVAAASVAAHLHVPLFHSCQAQAKYSYVTIWILMTRVYSSPVYKLHDGTCTEKNVFMGNNCSKQADETGL